MMKPLYLIFAFSACLILDGVNSNPRAKRIVGGEVAEIEDTPWQAALMILDFPYRRKCGASIIAELYSLTAGHCVSGQIQHFSIVYGSTTPFLSGTQVKVIQVHVHPKFTPMGSELLQNDIAILRLKNSVIFSPKVQAIPLRETETNDKEEGVVAGWGINEKGVHPQILMKVNTKVLGREKCYKLTGNESSILETMMCTRAKGKGSCIGDSGGAFAVNNAQVGIISWVNGECGDRKYTSVYTEVRAYREFINDITENTVTWVPA